MKASDVASDQQQLSHRSETHQRWTRIKKIWSQQRLKTGVILTVLDKQTKLWLGALAQRNRRHCLTSGNADLGDAPLRRCYQVEKDQPEMAELVIGLFLAFLFVWIPCGLFAALVAGDKGHGGPSWFFAGFFFGPIALVAAAGLSDNRLRKLVRRLVEQHEQGIAPITEPTPDPTPAPKDPNAPRSILESIDDAMDPDRKN